MIQKCIEALKRNAILLMLFMYSIVFGWIFYLYYYDAAPPISVIEPVTVSNGDYYPGDILRIEMSFCRDTDVPVVSFRTFRNGLDWSLPPKEISGSTHGCRSSTFSQDIPEELPPGQYILAFKNVYKVNPLAKRTVEFSTEEFTILPPQD